MIGLAKTAAGPGRLALIERPWHELAAGEVRIEVHGAGVCGTDLHIEAGEMEVVPPVTLGHEVAGTVVELGDAVDAGWLGAKVVTETYFATCGRCPLCRRGRPNLCPWRRSIGVHVDGGFAEHLVVPALNLHRVPDALDVYAATLAEPLACVCHCMLDPSEVAPGDAVLVIGPGPIGLLAAQVARTCGGTVTVSGLPHDAARLALARELGFEVADQPPAPESYDVVLECSGGGDGVAAGLIGVRRGGRLVQIGIYGAPVRVPFDEMLLKEVDVRAGFASTPPSWRRAMALIERGDVRLAPLVSDVVPLAAFATAFADLRAGRSAKVVFDPRLDA